MMAQDYFVKAREMVRISQFAANDVFDMQWPGIGWASSWFDARGYFGVVKKNGMISLFDARFIFIGDKAVTTLPFLDSRMKTESDGICAFDRVDALYIFRIGEKYYTDLQISKSEEESAILAWGRLLLVGDQSGSGVVYRGFLFDDDGSYRVLEDAEVVPWLLGQSKAFSYKSGVLYYGDSNLTGPHSGFDDDLNLYRGPATFPATGGYVKFGGFTSEEGFLFDYEGNYWRIDWTTDEAKHPILYYAGRDWGYREAPKKAVTTDSGLRIRLRASTDAFVLGSLGKGEAITILKTGETATLGGVTAPWYRIKKADGLIGWAFGGFIKVLE
ncbi:MAG: SH3 domain-containing protein [Spirochaetia bacterium]|nr:SH3 domain-containing protein [Spirochaetia bacterium]